MADETKPPVPSAPPTGANPAVTPHVQPKPGTDEAATARAAEATGSTPVPPAAGAAAGATAHTARPTPAPRPPAAVIPDLAGKTTNVASPGGQAAVRATPTAAAAGAKTATRDADDTS